MILMPLSAAGAQKSAATAKGAKFYSTDSPIANNPAFFWIKKALKIERFFFFIINRLQIQRPAEAKDPIPQKVYSSDNAV